MNSTRARALLVTTSYPFSLMGETFVAPEVEALGVVFDKFAILPMREAPHRRDVPPGTILMKPIARKNRIAFFLQRLIRPKTMRHFLSALHDCSTTTGLAWKTITGCLRFACYRSALEGRQDVQAFLREAGPCVVYAYWGHQPALAIPMSRAAGVATAVRYHGGDIYREQYEPLHGAYPWRAELHASTDLNVFISKHGQNYFNSHLVQPGSENRGAVFRLGSPDFGPPRPRPINGSDPMVMVSASNINANKRVHLIAQTAKALAAFSPVVWHHFGPEMTPELSAELTGEPPAGLTIVMHGQVSQHDLQAFYRSTDISFFINLSISEGVPVSVMEAMNADIPVVAPAITGLSELVLEGRSGLLIDVETAKSPALIAEIISRELKADGRLAMSNSRSVWEEGWQAGENAVRIANRLKELAIEVHAKNHPR